MHTFNLSSAAKVSHILGFLLKKQEKSMSYLKIKSRNLMIKSRVLRVIYPLKMHFSLKVIPQYLKNLSLAASCHTAEHDQVYHLLYKARGLGPPRPPEAVG